MLKFRHIAIAFLSLVASIQICSASSTEFVDRARPSKIVEVGVHALVGGSYITDNYANCFPEIRQANSNMGVAYGAGAGVTLMLREYFGFGTELNVVANHQNINVFTTDAELSSASNIYLRNSYVYGNIPVFASWRFNVASTVRWVLDAGVFYSYGLSGNQRQTIYRAGLNALDQMVYNISEFMTDFFKSLDTFQNAFHRSNMGIHLGSSLVFRNHFVIGGRAQFGLRNMAYVYNGITTPSMHSINFTFRLGWRF